MSVAASAVRPAAVRAAAAAYLQLTKPRIILLLLVTTIPAMVLADRGVPSVWLMLATLAGGTMAAGGANAINQYLERDIDEVMSRTRRRPLPAHKIEPQHALVFGIALGVAASVWLSVFVNVVSALLALSGLACYVFVYTVWLKRSTPQNIVIGGAAGAVPALVGWAAVTGRVGLPAVVLFAVVFLWTPPHFWALSLLYRRDYAAAGVPMLPVVAGEHQTTRWIVRYSLLLVAATLLLVPLGRMGVLYAASSIVLGAWFVWEAEGLRRHFSSARAMRLFRFSISYLALLFFAVAVDTVLRYGA